MVFSFFVSSENKGTRKYEGKQKNNIRIKGQNLPTACFFTYDRGLFYPYFVSALYLHNYVLCILICEVITN